MDRLYGKTQGLKPAHIKRLKALGQRRITADVFLTAPLARSLTEISGETGRRVGLLIDRRGNVDRVIVGDPQRVFLPDLGPRRAGAARFRGVRLVLTQLSPEGLSEDELTDLALLQLDSVILVRVGKHHLPGPVEYAHLLPPTEDGGAVWRVEQRGEVHGWSEPFTEFITDLESQFAQAPQLKRIDGRPAVILVGLTLRDKRSAQRSLDELARLADTAGLNVVETHLQNRPKADGRTYVGTGKLQELLVQSMHLGAVGLIFDRELSPSQLRNIATRTDLKVLDRTQLILDIFAQHATTREGRLQVELAQLRYRMPRLAIMPTAMSRLTGGIGGRGPGETKLEINRRRAQERLTRLERQLDKLAKGRETRRKQRKRSGIPVVGIVGYTNAGKSTLLNRVTQSEVLVRDQLFATLDATTRRFRFPQEREIVVSDTVGFIEDLPQTLVKAFKSTLEELDEADLLLHLVDSSDTECESHLVAVRGILADLGLAETPEMLVWNKADLADPEQLRNLMDLHGGLAVSALTGGGCDAMLDRIERALFHGRLDALRDERASAG